MLIIFRTKIFSVIENKDEISKNFMTVITEH